MTTVEARPDVRRRPVRRPQRSRRVTGLVLTAAVLVLLVYLSLAVGTRTTGVTAVWDAVTRYDPDNTDHLVIRELRLPRTVIGLLAGAALGLAGAVMQGVTRNPLADPGLLGVNAGASLFVVLSHQPARGHQRAGLHLVRLRRRRGGVRSSSTAWPRWAATAPPRSSWPWPGPRSARRSAP